MREMEKQWVHAAIINKDTKYFGYLVNEHQKAVRGYLRRLTKGNDALADDLAQETFLNAFRRISTYKNTGSFKSWLFSIAYRCFLTHIRKNSTNPLMNFPVDNFEETKVPDQEILKEARQVIDKIDIENAFKHLKKNERSTISLCYTYGMSHSEIAKIMDMPIGTVKSHILRGKEKLAKILNPISEDVLC